MAEDRDMFQQVGKLIMFAGLAIAAMGAAVYLLGRAGLGRLPGDLAFGSKGWRVYLPITTSLLLSAVLTLLLYVLIRLRK